MNWTDIAKFDVSNDRNGVKNVITTESEVGRIAMTGNTLQVRNITSGSHNYEFIEVFAIS